MSRFTKELSTASTQWRQCSQYCTWDTRTNIAISYYQQMRETSLPFISLCRLIQTIADLQFISEPLLFPLSLLLGVTHSSDYHMWQRNEFASNGVREFAEKGEAWTIMKEVEVAGERIQSVYGILSAPAVVGGTGQMNTEFEVFARHSYVRHSTPGFLQCGSGL